MVESLEILLSDTLNTEDVVAVAEDVVAVAEGVVAVAEDAVAVAIGWEVEGHRELKMAETSPDVASA